MQILATFVEPRERDISSILSFIAVIGRKFYAAIYFDHEYIVWAFAQVRSAYLRINLARCQLRRPPGARVVLDAEVGDRRPRLGAVLRVVQ